MPGRLIDGRDAATRTRLNDTEANITDINLLPDVLGVRGATADDDVGPKPGI